jgi:hypothetical protein
MKEIAQVLVLDEVELTVSEAIPVLVNIDRCESEDMHPPKCCVTRPITHPHPLQTVEEPISSVKFALLTPDSYEPLKLKLTGYSDAKVEGFELSHYNIGDKIHVPQYGNSILVGLTIGTTPTTPTTTPSSNDTLPSPTPQDRTLIITLSAVTVGMSLAVAALNIAVIGRLIRERQRHIDTEETYSDDVFSGPVGDIAYELTPSGSLDGESPVPLPYDIAYEYGSIAMGEEDRDALVYFVY